MRFTLRLFTNDGPFEDLGDWRTLAWIEVARWGRRLKQGNWCFSAGIRFRGWRPFALIGRRGSEFVWPKYQPRPWDEEKAA